LLDCRILCIMLGCEKGFGDWPGVKMAHVFCNVCQKCIFNSL